MQNERVGSSDIIQPMTDTNEEVKLGTVSDQAINEDYLHLTEGQTGILTNPQSNPHKRKKLSKGRMIIGATLLAAASSGFGYGIGFKLPDLGNLANAQQNETQNSPDTNPYHIGEGQAKNETLVLNGKEESFRDQMIGYMNWTPDGPITYYTTAEGKRRYLLTGGQDNGTYMIETDGKQTLKDILGSGTINKDSFTKVYSPEQSKSQYEYVGITGVLQTDKSNPNHLLGIAHCEQRTSRDASADYTATIGLTESFNGGKTWTDKGPLILGKDIKEPGGGKVSGAGQPTVIYNPKDGYAYIMYIDWSAKRKHPDQLYMARAKANDNGTLGQIEYYTNDGFSTDFNKEFKSVIPVPEGSNMVYAALPHISWNTELNQFTVQGESDTGFWTSDSTDLVNWSNPQEFYNFTQMGGKPHSILQVGEKWNSYPTILSENMPNSQLTNKSGVLFESDGDNITPHEPATIEFIIK